MKIRYPIGLQVVNVDNQLEFTDCGSRLTWDPACLSNVLLLKIILFCNNWRTEAEVVNYIMSTSDFSYEKSKKALTELLHKKILIDKSDKNHQYLYDNIALWDKYNWQDALLYHWCITLYPFLDYSEASGNERDLTMMKEFVSNELPPPNYKNYINKRSIKLDIPSNINQLSVNTIFDDKKSAFHREVQTIQYEEFSWITYLGFGQTRARKMQITGMHVAKTSPSGGSRHPTEVYLLIFTVEGLQPGLYHYNVEQNSIELLKEGLYESFLYENILVGKKRINFNPKFVYLYSTIFERSMFRYREPRSYRVLHFDLGHLMQTVYYLASARQLNSYSGYSMNDSIVDDLIGVDGYAEASIGFTVIG